MDQADKPSSEHTTHPGNARDQLTSSDESDADFLLPGRLEERRGSRPGDVRVRIVRPSHPEFRRVSQGILEATEAAYTPQGRLGKAISVLKRVLIGVPIATTRAEYERLTKFKALAVLSSDAISSVAYATEAILINLVAAGSGHLGLTLPISLVIVGLLCIVAISYRQTIPAYPNGGGSYIVAKENLGTLAGLIAAAALLIDYVLNVAVSIAAGVQNLASLFSALAPYVVPLDIALVALMMILNLRGVRESGSIFALPTYFLIGSAILLIAVGLVKAFVFQHQPVIGQYASVKAIEPLTIFLILPVICHRLFRNDGRRGHLQWSASLSEARDAQCVYYADVDGVILGTLFLGITLLATTYHVEANAAGNPTVIAQIASQVFSGPLIFMFPVFQLATLGILTLSAETATPTSRAWRHCWLVMISCPVFSALEVTAWRYLWALWSCWSLLACCSSCLKVIPMHSLTCLPLASSCPSHFHRVGWCFTGGGCAENSRGGDAA